MLGADVARVARSPPSAVGRAFVCVLRAAGTPSTMIAAGKLVDREASPTPSNKD